MRYRILAYPLLGGFEVIISSYKDDDTEERLDLWHMTIPADELKVDDLQHFLEWVYRAVCESTP